MLKLFTKIFIMILAAIIFISPASAKESSWQPEIKIGILSGVNRVELQFSAPCVMVDVATKKTLKKISADKNFSVSLSDLKNNSIEIRGEKIKMQNLICTINGKKYFGGVRLDKKNNSLTVINIAPVEEYLRGVVPIEMSPSFHVEALKAQVVAARSYTLKNRNRHSADGYELCASNHCQFYGGVDSASPVTDKIISETRGTVLFHGEKIVDTNFHTDSGGMTESVAEVWGTSAPHLQPVEELEKHTQAWKLEFAVNDFSSRFGGSFGKLKSIKLSPLKIGKSAADRSTSGRVKTAQIVGSKKTLQVTGNELRSKFSLPSTLFDMKISGGNVIFEGYGRGHGVGMSQYGANAYAKNGWDYEKILKHYYRGTNLKKLY